MYGAFTHALAKAGICGHNVDAFTMYIVYIVLQILNILLHYVAQNYNITISYI